VLTEQLRQATHGRLPALVAAASHFDFDHLPPDLRAVSKLFHDLAVDLFAAVPHDDPQLTIGVHDLLRAKDCAVRAAIAGRDRALA